jgi:predicted Zn-dependent peptidase
MREVSRFIYDKIDEKYIQYKHTSGMNVIVIPKRGHMQKRAEFVTEYGSLDNEFMLEGSDEKIIMPYGIAHFLEHKLFEQEYGNVMDKFAELGSNPNAYTSYNRTAYTFSCTDKFAENLDLLLSYVQTPYIDDESVEREKGIIAQEILMYEDDPDYKVYSNLMEQMYINNPIRNSVAGTVESIRNITRDNLMDCYNAFYHPSNMTLFITGDVNEEKVFDAVDKHIASQGKIFKRPKVLMPQEPDEIGENFRNANAQINLPVFEMGIKTNSIGTDIEMEMKRSVAIKLVMKELFDTGSEVFEKLFSEGLINDSFEYDSSLDQRYGHIVIGGESANPKKVYDVLIKYIEQKKRMGLDDKIFAVNKNAFKGSYIRGLNSIKSIDSGFVHSYYKGMNMFDYFNVYDKIDIGFVNEVLQKEFNLERIALSIING